MNAVAYKLNNSPGSRLKVGKIPASHRPDDIDIAAMSADSAVYTARNNAVRANSERAAAQKATR